MPAPYINTPRTNDASYLSNDGLDGITPEKSFAAPQENGDLIAQMRKGANGMNLKTPRANGRDPLKLILNGNQANGRPEFTPLMRSVTKTNMARRLSAKRLNGIDTPAHLRNSYVGRGTPALPRMEESNIHSELTGSSAGRNDNTPMLQNISSSVQSTPLAQLPGRDAVVSDGNMMTLREQENIIDKIEKENFGLKMKIHFLEEAIARRGGEFNQAALKENTDLKVNRITMQRELHKFKKTLAQAERDAEIYRQQLEEYRERVRRKQIDESIRIEVENVRAELKIKDAEIDGLRSKYEAAKDQGSSTSQKLHDEISDLQAELREKDRQLDEKDDEIDSIKLSSKQDSHVVVGLEDELEVAKQQIEELKEDLEKSSRDMEEAKEDRDEAVEEKRRAEDNLEELRDEMANKSFSTKGLSRQLEEKADKLEEENQELEAKHHLLREELDVKTQTERKLQERLREVERELSTETRNLQQQVETYQSQCEAYERKHASIQKQAESLEQELKVKSDEKDLLQVRHDALTNESAELQRELDKARSAADLDGQQSAQLENMLRTQHRNEIDMLNEQVDALHREVNAKEKECAGNAEDWEAQRRSLESLGQRAEEKAAGLQRTVDKLHDAQGTLTGREMRLQEALESEKQRHIEEEKSLSKQIQELNDDLAAKRTASDGNRSELNNAKEELRISIREQAVLKEKISELEDEIEVLQADIEQEHEFIQQLQRKSSNAAEEQLMKLHKDKKDLQESLASATAELHSAKRAVEIAETERDDLETKLEKAQHEQDHTFDVQQEKRELRRVKQRLEGDLEKLRSERDNLAATNQELEIELNAEIDRASTEESRLQREIDQLKTKQLSQSEGKDREFASAKNKVARLEQRITELEELLENQSRRVSSRAGDTSELRNDLADLRKNSAEAQKRETDLKAANRDLKIKVNDLERDLHEANLAQLKSRSPSASPPSHSKELAKLRQDLIDARSELKVLQDENRVLKRAARQRSAQNTEHVDMEALAKSSSEELRELAAQLNDRNDELDSLRFELRRLREEHAVDRNHSMNNTAHAAQLGDLRAQVKRLRSERDELRGSSAHAPSRHADAISMKLQLQRLREERARANKKAEAVEQELDVLQSRYESVLEKLTSGRHSKDDIREREMKGLIKEIMWLKAKCRREERLRTDLAWSKGYLERGEAMRAQCNQVDLRILRDMGVSIDGKKYEKPLTPKQKFRAGVFAVVAAIRMSNLEEQWRDAKLIGEELKAKKKRIPAPHN